MGALDIPVTEGEAKRVTESIRLLLGSIANTTDKVLDQIEKAKAGEAWRPLGYESWTAYAAAEFGEALKRLSRVDRLPAVVKMHELGMSTRAIGEVVGVGKSTVARDLSGVPSGTPDPAGEEDASPDAPEPRPITGRDGKTYKPARILPSGKVDAATVEAMGKAVPPIKRVTRRPPVQRFEAAADRLLELGHEIAEAPDQDLGQVLEAIDAAVRMLTFLRRYAAKSAGDEDA